MITHEVSSSTDTRVLGLDAARGTAMLFVCVSHFANAYLVPVNATRAANLMTAIGMIATPTFIVVSALLMGYVAPAAPGRLDAYRVKLFDRGLFLLIVGHLWMSITASVRAGGLSTPLKHAFITDVIGVALLIMVPIVAHTSWQRRVQVGLGVALLGYVISLLWQPTVGWVEVLEETLIGWSKVQTFPLLPWLGVYLAATGLGSALRPLLTSGRQRDAGHFMLSLGLGMSAIALLLRAALQGQPASPGTPVAVLNALTTPWEKVPPSPGYLLFFGGAGLALAGALLAAPPALRVSWPYRAATLLGRNSLFAYLAQNAIYFLLLYSLALPYVAAWPLLFAASVGTLFLLVWLWAKINGNRFFTIGYPALRAAVRGRLHRAPPPAVR